MKKRRIVLLSFLALVLVVTCALAVACDKTEKFNVTWELDDKVDSVSIEGYKFAKTMELEKGTEVSFKITFKTNYEALSVKVGGKTIQPDNGVYTFSVKQDITVKIDSAKIIKDFSVNFVDANKVYYAGDKIANEDVTITVNYVDGKSDPLTTDRISYTKGSVFGLGDTSFKVSYRGYSQEIDLGYEVKGLVILDLSGGFFSAEELAKLPAGFVKVNDSLYRYEFTAKLTEDIELPQPTYLLDPEDEESALYFDRWSGIENSKIPAGLETSLTATALYNNTLVNVTEMKFVEENGKPYLVINGEFVAANSAYLFLFEGNNPPVEYAKKTYAESTGGKSFTLKFDLIEFITSTPINPDTREEIKNSSFLGKWMDIRFCVEYGDKVIHQELFVSDEMTYADLGDDIVGAADDGKFYRFFYETWTPNEGDGIKGVPGATFTGTEKILKLHCEETDGFVITGVTLAEKESKPYLVISGKALGGNKEDIEASLAGFIFDMQNYSNWSNVDIDGMQTVTVNDDLTFEITLCLDNIKDEGLYVMHQFNSSTNFDPSNYDRNAKVTVGSRIYTLTEADPHGWGWAWTCIKMEDATYALNKSVILENDTPYFVLMGDAGEKTAEAIKALLTQFDFEDATDSSNKIIIPSEKIFVTVENGIYTVKVDVSELPIGQYWVHAVGLIDGNGDVHPDASKPAVTADGKTYRGIDKQESWGIAHLLDVAEASDESEPPVEPPVELEIDDAATYTVVSTELAEQEGKVVLIVKGTVVGHVEGKVVYVATVRNGTNDNNWENVKRYADVKMTVDADGNFVVIWDLTNLAVGSQYYIHFGAHEQDLPCKTVNTDKLEVTIDGIKYSIVDYNRDDNGSPQIKVAEEGAPSLTFTGATLENNNNRAILVLTATFENYTEAQLKTIQYYETKDGMVLGVKEVEISGNSVTLYFDFTDVEVIQDWWWGHWSINGTEMGDIKCPVTTNKFVIGGREYQLDTQWDMPIIIISEV